MAKKGSAFLKGFGSGFQILKNIIDAVLAHGGDDRDISRLLSNSDLVKQIAELIMSKKKRFTLPYKVIVDYGKSLAEMIEEGNYNFVSEKMIDEHFQIAGTGQLEVELVLVHMNLQDITNRKVLNYMNSLGLEPAKIEHLLAFGAANPDVQLEFPIIALSSVLVGEDGGHNYPILCEHLGDERALSFSWIGDDNKWTEHWRFLAFRKVA